jgi:hypothetical protein
MECLKQNNLKTIRGARTIPVIDGKIKWHLDETILPDEMDKYKIILSFQKVFQIIQSQFGEIIFESTGEIKEAPIIIKFASNELNNMPNKFEEGVLAYAYGNFDNFEYASDLFINMAYNWSEMHKPDAINLVKVAVHEILHALGFDHSDIKSDILFWQYQENDEINFSEDTKAKIREFYKLKQPISKDLKTALKNWVNDSIGYTQINERSLISLAKEIGLILHPVQPKSTNQTLFKKYVNE